MSIPVLTYHSLNVWENRYDKNDHLAFASDLRTIDQLGMRIVPLETVVDWHAGRLGDEAVAGAVAMTMDDGSSLDYRALAAFPGRVDPGSLGSAIGGAEKSALRLCRRQRGWQSAVDRLRCL